MQTHPRPQCSTEVSKAFFVCAQLVMRASGSASCRLPGHWKAFVYTTGCECICWGSIEPSASEAKKAP